MGNCLVMEGGKVDVIKIMRIDGKILEYKSPMKVQQVLSEFAPGHSIADALPVVRHLDPTADMRAGHLYYLLRPNNKAKAAAAAGGVVRSVKVVISKQELKEILEREGLTLEDMMSQVQKKKKKIPGNIKAMGWKPDLESIPEGINDLYLE